MKKYYFNLFIALMAVMGFTACSSDKDDYEWATVTGNQVYFSNTLPSSINLSKSANTFAIPVSRVDSAAAAVDSVATDSVK